MADGSLVVTRGSSMLAAALGTARLFARVTATCAVGNLTGVALGD